MDLDILMLTSHDWANTTWKFFQCAYKHLNLNVLAFKGNLHPFLYPEQVLVIPELKDAEKTTNVVKSDFLSELFKTTKIVHYFTSTFIVPEDFNPGDRPAMVMNHGGKRYRLNHKEVNKNQNIDHAIIQMPDLLGKGTKKETLIYFPVDTGFIQPHYSSLNQKIVIGHFPPHGIKGQSTINSAIERLKQSKFKDSFVFLTSIDSQFSWIENLQHMAVCDIIIDNMAMEANGEKYGEWGNISFEAAALGKIVVTASLGIEDYYREYGDCELVIANTEDELYWQLERLISMKSSQIDMKKRVTREWVERNHSFPATAKRLYEKVYRELLV
jgi:hypothetical protein